MSDTLGVIVTEALTIRDQLKAGGMVGDELDRGLEAVLRDTWPKPKGRTEPWHDVCDACRDYGLEMHWCPGDVTCGRVKVHAEHEYGRPCWCKAGRKHHEKAIPTEEDAVTLAAKRKPMSRWAR